MKNSSSESLIFGGYWLGMSPRQDRGPKNLSRSWIVRRFARVTRRAIDLEGTGPTANCSQVKVVPPNVVSPTGLSKWGTAPLGFRIDVRVLAA